MKNALYVMVFLFMMSVQARAASRQYGPEESQVRLLIATEPTKFKNQLVNKMIKELDDGNTTIKVIDHRNGGMDQEKSTDYTVVFITGSGVMSKVRPWISAWILRQADTTNILLHTTQIYNWTVKDKVDAVTSASDVKGSDELASQYVALIKEKLKK